jgi:hypothetical protein
MPRLRLLVSTAVEVQGGRDRWKEEDWRSWEAGTYLLWARDQAVRNWHRHGALPALLGPEGRGATRGDCGGPSQSCPCLDGTFGPYRHLALSEGSCRVVDLAGPGLGGRRPADALSRHCCTTWRTVSQASRGTSRQPSTRLSDIPRGRERESSGTSLRPPETESRGARKKCRVNGSWEPGDRYDSPRLRTLKRRIKR